MSKWSKEQKALFNQHAGIISDGDLAVLIGRPESDVWRRRRQYRIKCKIFETPKYSEQMQQFVRDNFRTMSNDEIAGIFNTQYPEKTFTKYGIRGLITALCLKRTEEDIIYIKKRCQERGVYKEAAARAALKLIKHKVGELCYVFYSNRRRLCIRVASGKAKTQFRPYERWLWEQAHGPVGNGHKLEKINPLLPYSLENLRLVPKFTKHKVGDLVTRHLAGVPRVYIKLANNKYKHYEIYLWEQHYGDVPHGRMIKKIDPTGPLTIENLYAAKLVGISRAAKDLPDWFVRNTFKFPASIKGFITNEEISLQREKILLQRALKVYENGATTT